MMTTNYGESRYAPPSPPCMRIYLVTMICLFPPQHQQHLMLTVLTPDIYVESVDTVNLVAF